MSHPFQFGEQVWTRYAEDWWPAKVVDPALYDLEDDGTVLIMFYSSEGELMRVAYDPSAIVPFASRDSAYKYIAAKLDAVTPAGGRIEQCAADPHRAAGDPAGLLDQADQGIGDGRLARTRFADHSVDLARRDRERHAIHGDEQAAIRLGIFDAEILDRECGDGRHPRDLSFGLNRSRSQSPITFTASTRMTSANAGKRAIHQMPEKTNSLPMRIRVPSDG
jgi:hypothetical protein